MYSLILLIASLSLFAMVEVSEADDAPPPASNIGAKEASRELEVPSGWRVAVNGPLIKLISPKEMKLDPSPFGGLPPRSLNRQFSITIKVGEKCSIKEVERRAREEMEDRADDPKGKGPPSRHEWIPDFFDDQRAYEVEFPRYRPAEEEDKKAVNECYLLVRRHWAVYPSSPHVDLKFFSARLSFGQKTE